MLNKQHAHTHTTAHFIGNLYNYTDTEVAATTAHFIGHLYKYTDTEVWEIFKDWAYRDSRFYDQLQKALGHLLD